MRLLSQFFGGTVVFVASLGSAAGQSPVKAGEGERASVIVVQAVQVAKTQANGRAWDVFNGKPDLRVAIKRDDPRLEKQVADLQQRRYERLKALESVQDDEFKKTLDGLGPEEKKRRSREWQNKTSARQKEREKDGQVSALAEQINTIRRQYYYATPEAVDTFSARFETGAVSVRPGDTVHIRVSDVDLAIDDLIGATDVEITSALLQMGRMQLRFGQVLSLELEFRATTAVTSR